jgi:uncharacterized membrane protein YraQ (UPF0718 family)
MVVLSGMPPACAIMSIAAISLPELLILKKVMHWRALALFTGIVAVSITLVGLLFNLIF